MEDSPSSTPSIFSSLNSFFTPTIFFVILNLTIAAIVVTSNLPNNNQQNHHQENEEEEKKTSPPDVRPKNDGRPSILHRLKSFNFHPPLETHDEQQQALQVAATDYVFNQPLSALNTHLDFDPTRSDQAAQQETATNHLGFDPTHQGKQEEAGFEGTHEDQKQEFESLDDVYNMLKGGNVGRTKSDTLPASMEVSPAKMKKSASLKTRFEKEKTVEARRPATVRERKSPATVTEEVDVEVDAKADDFINKFKNDLKLQRIDSIIRWKGGASRGTG